MARKQSPRTPTVRGVFLLSQLGSHVTDQCLEVLAPVGLHPAHYVVLHNLAAGDSRTQQEIADRMGVHRNVMVGLVDALEEQGFVTRARRHDDRRAYDVHLTTDGRAALALADNVVDHLEADTLRPLTPAERGQLITLLHKLTGHHGLPDDVHPGIRRKPGTGGRLPVRPPR